MISPAHTVSADENLSFFYNNNFNSYSVESGVWVSNASGDPIANPSDFSEVFDIDANFSEDVWVSHEYDLSSYVGQTIYVAFKYRGDLLMKSILMTFLLLLHRLVCNQVVLQLQPTQ